MTEHDELVREGRFEGFTEIPPSSEDLYHKEYYAVTRDGSRHGILGGSSLKRSRTMLPCFFVVSGGLILWDSEINYYEVAALVDF